jgi:UDP-glucose 4-epimerase
MKTLITGGAGFIGSHLADELLARGYQVTVLDNLSNGSLANLEFARQHANFRFIKGDILNISDCMESTRGVDCVFHLACLGVRHSLHSPLENHKVNAEGTLNVLGACLQNKVKKIFYISTSEIYGGVDTFPIKEDAVPRPFTVYGASKLAGEHYTAAYRQQYGLNATILRIFNNYGPRAHYESDAGEIIPRSIVKALYGKQPIINGDGAITRDFFYVKDTAKALADLIGIPGLDGVTMNIGTGIECSLLKIIEKILLLMDKKDLGIDYIESRPADVPRLWVNADKFYQLTKFKPRFSFEIGLLETIEFYKNLAKTKDLLSQIKLKNWEKA